jgi:hypothetical protein
LKQEELYTLICMQHLTAAKCNEKLIETKPRITLKTILKKRVDWIQQASYRLHQCPPNILVCRILFKTEIPRISRNPTPVFDLAVKKWALFCP